MIVEIRADQSRRKPPPDDGAGAPAAAPEPMMLDRDQIVGMPDDRPIRPDDAAILDAGDQLPNIMSLEDYSIEAPIGADDRRWAAPAAALLASLAWVGAVGWLAWRHVPAVAPADWFAIVSAMAAVPALIGIAWLLLLRTSRAESRRFGHTAEAMRAEAAALERSVAAITHTLDGNRRDLAGQMEQLSALGTAAGDRLATIGHGIAAQVAAADAHAARLSEAARTARTEVGLLLAALPDATGHAEGLGHALEGSGSIAQRSVDALAAQLDALAERSRDAEALAVAAAAALAARTSEIDLTSERAALRLESAAGATAASVDMLLGRTTDTVEAAQRRIDGQGEAMTAMVAAHQARLDAAARDSAGALAERLDGIEAVVERLSGRLDEERVAGDGLMTELEGGIVRVAGRMDALHQQGVERSQLLAASISALGGSADAMTEALRAGEAMATRTIGTTETLLIALDSAAREIDETLPDALARLDARILQSKGVVVQAKPELLALVTAAESTHDAIEAIAGVIADQRRVLDQLSAGLEETLSGGKSKADALGKMVDETIQRSHRFAEEAAPRLVEALLRVRETAAAAADHARATLGGVIPEAADALRDAAADAMRTAAADTVSRQIDAIAEATDAAVVAASRATERIADQVRQVTEQTALIDARIEDARTEREAADRDTLSRRVSLLIESLNSASIDITRAFAPEVSDSAWAAYLKGDRGVFTRRAVRLLDAADTRDIVRLYDGDAGFREQVNRYIHDFEAMLRGILAQRDGSPLGVTLLSSDMGKLYVALAQAIERLR